MKSHREEYGGQYVALDGDQLLADVWTILDTEISPIELMDGTTRRVKPDAPVIDDGCRAPEEDTVRGFGSNEILSVYAPGRESDVWPEGTARRIPAGSNIILQMHYSKGPGGSEEDRTRVAIVFAKAPVENRWARAEFTTRCS